MTERTLWERAASCYQNAGVFTDAARCYHHAHAYQRAADLYTHLGDHRAAAGEYAAAGDPDEAAWRLVHLTGDPTAARTLLADADADADAAPVFGADADTGGGAGTGTDHDEVDGVLHSGRSATGAVPAGTHRSALARRALILARCDLAERLTQRLAIDATCPTSVLAALSGAQNLLDSDTAPIDPRVEEWAVALAVVARRSDQVALTFAAAVRGRRPGAGHRWNTWMTARHGTAIVIPEPTSAPAGPPQPTSTTRPGGQ